MIMHVPRKAPDPLGIRVGSKPVWSWPFWVLEWGFEWLSYGLSHWALLEVLQYMGTFGVLIAVIFYFAESSDRLKQKHYQAWQVVNTAQGKGGNGGRVEALQELNSDRVSLTGVDVSGAFLQGIRLEKAHLARANFDGADARDSDFQNADLSNASLRSANFRNGDLRAADFAGAELNNVDLFAANLSKANFSGAVLDDADLCNSNLQDLRWRQIRSVRNANLYGAKNAPGAFLAWALENGAVQKPHD
jgi:hypothetical protein